MKESKNATRADDQQERLINIGWIIGFVDGEGCFSITFNKQSNRIESKRIRKGYKIGYQISAYFAVVQGEKSLDSLNLIKNYFKVGGIYIKRRKDNHKEDMYHYTVSAVDDLLNVIVPFFEENRLRTSKRNDFKLFKKCLLLIKEKKHLTSSGAIQIAKVCEQMNRQKSRTDIIRILRDQTSDSS